MNEGPQLLLSACLSCDGCLSEEESLKISQQSLEEVERVLALNKVRCTLSQPEEVREFVLLHFEKNNLLYFFIRPRQKCDVTKHKVLVASVCPQSLPYFAVKLGLDVNEAAHKLCGFLKSLGEFSGRSIKVHSSVRGHEGCF